MTGVFVNVRQLYAAPGGIDPCLVLQQARRDKVLFTRRADAKSDRLNYVWPKEASQPSNPRHARDTNEIVGRCITAPCCIASSICCLLISTPPLSVDMDGEIVEIAVFASEDGSKSHV